MYFRKIQNKNCNVVAFFLFFFFAIFFSLRLHVKMHDLWVKIVFNYVSLWCYRKGDDIQKLSVIETLPSLLAGDAQSCISRLMPKMQQTLPTASTEFHVAASTTFKTILEKRLVSHSTFTQTFLQSILNSLDSRDPGKTGCNFLFHWLSCGAIKISVYLNIYIYLLSRCSCMAGDLTRCDRVTTRGSHKARGELEKQKKWYPEKKSKIVYSSY